jgi:hypothetical protein
MRGQDNATISTRRSSRATAPPENLRYRLMADAKALANLVQGEPASTQPSNQRAPFEIRSRSPCFAVHAHGSPSVSRQSDIGVRFTGSQSRTSSAEHSPHRNSGSRCNTNEWPRRRPGRRPSADRAHAAGDSKRGPGRAAPAFRGLALAGTLLDPQWDYHAHGRARQLKPAADRARPRLDAWCGGSLMQVKRGQLSAVASHAGSPGVKHQPISANSSLTTARLGTKPAHL